MRGLGRYLLALLLLVQAGCTGYLVVQGGEVREDRVRAIRRGLVSLRGLAFTKEVPIEVKGEADMKAYLEQTLERDYGDEKLRNLSQAYARLGLLPRALDLRKALLEFYDAQVVAFYDSRAKKLFLPRDLTGGGGIGALQFLAQRDFLGEMVLAHELTHALQDQHFDVEQRLEQSGNDDAVLALHCLVEGDAVLAGFGYIFGSLDGETSQRVSDEVQKSTVQTRADLSSRIPEAVLEPLLFQYDGGVSFVARLFKERGWPGVDRAYSSPPLSTEQVIHPTKYLDNPDPPSRIHLGSVRSLFPEDWSEIENNTLGELMIQVLLRRFLSADDARAGADGWDGDRFVAYSGGSQVAFLWATVWDSAAEAEEFARSYERVRALRNQKSGQVEKEPYLEQRGSRVVVVEGLDRDRLSRQVEKIWLEMKIEEPPF